MVENNDPPANRTQCQQKDKALVFSDSKKNNDHGNTIVNSASKLNRASFLFLLVHFHLRIMPGNDPLCIRCPLASVMATEVFMSSVITVILKMSNLLN